MLVHGRSLDPKALHIGHVVDLKGNIFWMYNLPSEFCCENNSSDG